MQLTESSANFDCLVAHKMAKTEKFLIALCRGVPIVGEDWVVECVKSRTIKDPWEFLLKDPENEKLFHVDLACALKRAIGSGGVLKGYRVFYTPNCVPAKGVLKRIVEAASGKALLIKRRGLKQSLNEILQNKDCAIVVSSDADMAMHDDIRQAGISVHYDKFIVDCLLRQELLLGEKQYIY